MMQIHLVKPFYVIKNQVQLLWKINKKKTASKMAASCLMNFSGGGDGDISKAICLSSTVLLTIVGAL